MSEKLLWNKYELTYSETSDKFQTLDENNNNSPTVNSHGSNVQATKHVLLWQNAPTKTSTVKVSAEYPTSQNSKKVGLSVYGNKTINDNISNTEEEINSKELERINLYKNKMVISKYSTKL